MIPWHLLLFISLPEQINWVRMFQFFIVLYFSISFHECAHAWAANRNGDDTARLMGRMTLNPLPHIDIVGTVIIPLLGFFFSGIRLIGWGKPVPVNPLRFKNHRRGEIETSLAGPLSNLLLVIGSLLLLRLLLRVLSGWSVLTDFLWMAAVLNMVLCLFNLIPIYPLDGSHILRNFLSKQALETYDRVVTPYGPFLLLVLLNVGALDFIFRFGLRAAFLFLRV